MGQEVLSAQEHEVCRQIMEIMQVYREQAASSYGVDTPGGLEHMGDVWRLLGRWDEQLRNAQKVELGNPSRRAITFNG